MNPTSAQRPRVLFVAPELPHPPFTGAHTRPLSIVRALAHAHEVTVVGAAPAGADLSALEEAGAQVVSLTMAPYARSATRAALSRGRQLLSPVPLISRGYSPVMGRLAEETAAQVGADVVHLVSMYSCWYRNARLPAVIDLLDVVSGLCESAAAAHRLRYAAARVQMRTSQRLEIRQLTRMTAVIAINGEDQARLARLGVQAAVVPLAMSIPRDDEIAGDERSRVAAGVGASDAKQVELLFVGNFAHHPNRASAAFLESELVPELRRRGLRFSLTIAGRGANAVAGRRRAAGGAAGEAGADARRADVAYLADVPDLGRLYRAADLVVEPIVFGGGTKNKTLEAMAWGKAVVGSGAAFSGVGARAGEAYVRVPLERGAMAAAVAGLVADRRRRAAIGQAAREYVLHHHSQAIVDEAVAELYGRVLAARL
jgi:polysaccharide biosynthesis protein PslH